MTKPNSYALGQPVFCVFAGRYRASVYQVEHDGRTIVGAGYGDTPEQALAQGRAAINTIIAADKLIEEQRQAIAFAGPN